MFYLVLKYESCVFLRLSLIKVTFEVVNCSKLLCWIL